MSRLRRRNRRGKRARINAISHTSVADTESWEQKTAQALEQMDEVVAYVKNHNLDFTIPYTNHNGVSRHYVPDFIARIRKQEGDSTDKVMNLILETSGNGAAKIKFRK